LTFGSNYVILLLKGGIKMDELKKLKIQLQEKENELSKNLQTFVLNPNICNLVTEISDIKEKISLLEDNNNGEKSD
jgi:hypothetical protein